MLRKTEQSRQGSLAASPLPPLQLEYSSFPKLTDEINGANLERTLVLGFEPRAEHEMGSRGVLVLDHPFSPITGSVTFFRKYVVFFKKY